LINNLVKIRSGQNNKGIKLKAKECAGGMGVDPSTYSHYENGKREPTLSSLEILSNWLYKEHEIDVTLDDFFTIED